MKRRCEEAKTSLLRLRTATKEEIADYWPGGKVNDVADPLGKWIFCWANLVGMLRRKQPEVVAARVDEAMSAALAREPVRVVFEDGSIRSVHPKSYHALRWLDTLDKSVSDVVVAVADIGTDTDALKAITLLPLVESLAVRAWAWVLTHEDAGLPFDESQPLEPPAWTFTITPKDLLELFRAHIAVNVERLRIISEAFPSDRNEGTSRLSLSGFLGGMANETGNRSSDLLRRWSLGEAFAQAVASAQIAREARERSESKAG